MNAPAEPLLIDLFEPHRVIDLLSVSTIPVHDQGAAHWNAVGRAQRLEAAIRQIIREELDRSRALPEASLTTVPAPDKSDCYLVRFPDGATDYWVVNDPEGHYEFQPAGPS